MKNRFLFGLSVATGVIVMIGVAGYSYALRHAEPALRQLTAEVWVTEQLREEAVAQVRARGFATVIDLRPDGESPDQPAAAAMEAAAKANGMRFFYVPVAHGEIPGAAVAQLTDALTGAPRPVLLYCRSGRRAARTWSLVEASRPGGLDADAITRAVKNAGQEADDLKSAIQLRIANRQPARGFGS